MGIESGKNFVIIQGINIILDYSQTDDETKPLVSAGTTKAKVCFCFAKCFH